MYAVSAAYKAAMKNNVHRYRIRGTVGDVSFTEDNLLYQSLTITNQCSEGDEIKLGSVYTGELHTTFTGLNIPRKSWRGKVITLSEELLVGEDTWEAVPLGVFVVGDSVHSMEGVEVTAYDYMQNFDKKINLDTTNGSLYDFASFACQTCGVTLANADFDDFPNGGDAQFNLYSENDIETFRDFVFWIAQTMGCIATINRSGHLEFRQYSTDPVDEISQYHRLRGCGFSDFEVNYTGMSVVDIQANSMQYVYVEPDDGLTYNLGSNPLLQMSTEERTQDIIDAFSGISLTPFTCEVNCGAAYDLCDCIEFTGGLADDVYCGIMQYTYNYARSLRIEGFGKNPDLANARSKTDKDITGLMSRSADEMVFYDFMNTQAIHIADGQTKDVILIRFATGRDTHIDFHAEIKHTNSSTLTIKAFYLIDNEAYYYEPAQVEMAGVNLLHLMLSFEETAGSLGKVLVRITADGGDIDIAMSDAIAYLAGYGIGGGEIPWDGNIDIIEEWDQSAQIPSITFDENGVSADVLVAVQIPIGVNISDSVSRVTVPSMDFDPVGIIDTVAIDFLTRQVIIDTSSQVTRSAIYTTIENDIFELKTEYEEGSTTQMIDSGYCTKVTPFLTGLTVSDVVIA